MSRIRRITTPALAAALSALALGACGGSPSLDTADLELKLDDQLARTMGANGDAVSCPDEIKAERGHRFDCTVTGPEGEQVRVDVTLTNADGGFRAVFPRRQHLDAQERRSGSYAP